jgi:hypothetical protein
LPRHENLCCLKLWPEVSRDDRRVHDRLHIVNIERGDRLKLCNPPNFEIGRADLFALNPSYPSA